jgi:hypothetical protein
MLGLIVVLLLQAPANPPTPSPASDQAQPPAKDAKPARPKMICTEERVTGSRVATHKVCYPEKMTTGQYEMQRGLQEIQDNLPAPQGN